MRVMKAQVTVRPDQGLGTISPYVYGTTWDWRDAHWGGIWVGEESSIPHLHGFRRDAIDALKEIAVPIVQFFPQSPFYRWEDATGPREKRPNRLVPELVSVARRADYRNGLWHVRFRGCAPRVSVTAPLAARHGSPVAGPWLSVLTRRVGAERRFRSPSPPPLRHWRPSAPNPTP